MNRPASPPPANDPGSALTRPLAWLRAGWRDFAAVPVASALHGLLFVLFALVIVAIGWRDSGLLAGAFSGFVLVAPVLVTGFHELSRRLHSGEARPRFAILALIAVWRRRGARLAAFGLMLAAIGTAWVAFSTLLVRLSLSVSGVASAVDGAALGATAAGTAAGSAAEAVRAVGVAGFVRQFAQAGDGWLFVWFLAGGLVAAVVFAISAISVPMLVDRDVTLREAIRTSVAATGTHPVEMASWSALIMVLALVGSLTLIGLVLVVPLLGHATWHAYRDLAGS